MKHEQTVLVVNDMPDQLEMVSVILRQSGYGVLTATDGVEGFEMAQSARPDLVVSDVRMPRMDGFELCRSLRRQPGLRLTPVLLVSAHRRDSESVVAGLKAGADDYLEAPYDYMRLIAKVGRLLERRNVEVAAERGKERFRMLIENSSDIITIAGVDGTISYESPSVTRLLGYEPEELIGQSRFEFIHPDDVARARETFKRIFDEDGISQTMEHRFRHRNGSWCMLESTGKTFRDDSQELVAIINSRDVTERKRTESALRFQAHLLDTVEQAVIATDLEGRITYLNRFAATLYGWPVEEARGRNVTELFPARAAHEQASQIMALLGEGKSWSGEFCVKRRDGTEFPAMVMNAPLCDETGTTVGIVGISFDLSARKQTEKTLRQRERQLAEAQKVAHVGSWNHDIRTNALTWSDELYHIFGLQPDEFTPTRAAFIASLHPEDRARVLEVIESACREGGQVEYEYRIVRRDGEVRTIHSNRHVVCDERGHPMRAFGTLQDVTERRLSEEQLKSSNEDLRALSARLQSAREEESVRIAREIHDELGGALTGLKWDLSWLGKRMSEPELEAQRAMLKSMSDLIDETIQKVRNIATELRPAILDDFGLAAAIEWQAREFQRRTEIECHLSAPEEEVSLGAEKATAVFRIFQEILTNVARHAEASLVRISLQQRDGEVVLQVADNGRGIKERDIADQKSLGLLGMRERALVCGGRVHITGGGRGTTVTVSIPGE